jgi:hypothetical protein
VPILKAIRRALDGEAKPLDELKRIVRFEMGGLQNRIEGKPSEIDRIYAETEDMDHKVFDARSKKIQQELYRRIKPHLEGPQGYLMKIAVQAYDNQVCIAAAFTINDTVYPPFGMAFHRDFAPEELPAPLPTQPQTEPADPSRIRDRVWRKSDFTRPDLAPPKRKQPVAAGKTESRQGGNVNQKKR